MRNLFLTGLAAALLPLAMLAQPMPPRPLLPSETATPVALARQATTVSQLQQVLLQNYTAGAWVDASRTLYQRYRRPTQAGWVVSDTKTGSTWSAQSRVRYQYRPTGELLADTVDLFTTTPPGPYSAQVWSFDAQNRQALAWNQTRNAAASRWDSTSRVQYFYTGALKTRDLTQTYAARRFTNQTQTLYAYTGAGQLSILETQTWNPTAPAWGPASRLTYAYDALGRIQQVVSENVLAPATVLANYFRYTYQYNPQNRLSTLLGEIWQNNAWQPYLQTLYTYDPNGDPAILTTQYWTASASTYQNAYRQLFTYQQVAAAHAARAAAIGLRVLPNPSRGEAGRLTFAPLSGPATATVRDLTGRSLATVTVTAADAAAGSVGLPAALPAGLHLVELQASGQHWQAKWLKE